MKRNTFTLILIICFITCNPSLSYGATSRILSNEELDQVHASGLNFNFERFLSVLPSDPNNITTDILTEAFRVSYNPIVQTDNGNVTILSTTPSQPSSPGQPSQPTLPGTQMTQLATPAQPAAAAIPTSTTQPQSTNTSNTTTTQVTPVTILNEAIASLAALEANQNTNSTSSNNNSILPASASPTANKIANNTIQNPIQLDVLANTNGTASIDISNPLDADQIIDNILPDTSAFDNLTNNADSVLVNNGTTNIVDVSDTAQQYLSALVNVNSAGSTVPVTINLTVVINSTIENISNSNQVNLHNLHTYNF